MELMNNLLGLLALVCATLSGIAGIGVLTARRLKAAPDIDPKSKDPNAERKNES
ncbi:hypothetical protein G3T36_17455 [Diaminobutyricibacter tongyongensis]|uniref:Uncharacterized protein n=1 Tax=Leifsonia tongyongensis TaxID=1268043 RepID=A0A6L9Y2A1_9MICO|nr:hypothetical protein [Diaminobutyricibacter tongyongensis]NEN07645.1 hypothetical protein [Diaminobutyricibacter tongyongensis]